MRFPITRPNLALAAAGALLLGAGLAIGATQPTPFDAERVGVPTPTASFTLPDVLSVATEEDDPRWNCEAQGNRICGAAFTGQAEAAAWKLWDAYGGADRLLVNPHAAVSLAGYTVQDPYAPGTRVRLGTDEIALHGDGFWYVFRATNH